MSGTKKAQDLSAEFMDEFLSALSAEEEKDIVRLIVDCFLERNLPVKTKKYDHPSMEGTYRILCFIKKSAEAVIINNKGMGRDGMSIQVRIEDKNVFKSLSSFSDSIRNQILNAGDCGFCSTKCEGKKYVFTYQENEYVKCRFICNNFIFQNIGKGDFEGFIAIINNEITYGTTRKK